MTESRPDASPDPLRVMLGLGVIAALTLTWVCVLTLISGAAFATAAGIMLHAVAFGVVLTPRMCGADGAKAALKLALEAAAVVIGLSLLAYALGLGMPATALIGATLAALMGVLTVHVIYRGAASRPAAPVAEAPTRPVATATPATQIPGLRSDGTIPPDGAAELSFASGSRLGRYTLETRLAVGGMGEVWRASHDTLIRPAVLKIIRRARSGGQSSDAELIERFRREAMITANLTSPHTVHLYDFGIEGESSVYIAMELLEAMSVAALVSRFGPMEDARVAFLLRQACHSLIEAHDHGVVHRDIKPENLLVTRAGRDTDFLKVIDFGLVKDLGKKRLATGRQPRVQQLTALGARPGTPGYMAPEQIGGSIIDQRADIYALACVAYYALTAQPVFEGTEDAQLMFAHMQIEPDAPSLRLGRPIHPGLEAVVMRCLAKDPAERPQTMTALDEALAALSFGAPWTQERARQWWTDERMTLRTRARESMVEDGDTA